MSEDGEALALTDYVEDLAGEADVVKLRGAVKAMYNDGQLEDVDSAQLKVYENRAVYEDKTRRKLLRSSRLVAGLGEDEAQAMIVEVVPLQSFKRQKTLWQRATTLDPTASVLPLSGANDRVWKLDRAAIAGFGVPVPGSMLPLFCREDAAKLVEFLRDEVVRNGRTGYVSGPTGSGKSAASIAFALALAHTCQWVVTWIQLMREEPPICVRLEGNSKKTTELTVPYLEDLSTILNEIEDSKQHIAFLDEVVGDGNRNEVMVCTGWLRQNWDARRLAVISTPHRTIKNLDDATNLNVEEFKMSSWTLDEYLEAITNEELFHAVEPQLDASDMPKLTDSTSMEDWRRSLVESKYYFADGSARYMFGYRASEVVPWMNEIIEDVVDGQCSIERYNDLLSRDRGSGWQTVISRYAGSAVAMFGGPALVKRHRSILSCAAATRWVQEMPFLARIRKGGIHLNSSERNVFWPEDRCQVLDSKNVRATSDRLV